MSNSTRKKDIRRTPLSQLHNTASISSEKLSFTQDSGMSKQSFNSAPPVSLFNIFSINFEIRSLDLKISKKKMSIQRF